MFASHLTLALVALASQEPSASLDDLRAVAASELGIDADARPQLLAREGTARLYGNEVDWRLSVDAGGRIRCEFDGPLPRTVVFDGDDGWMSDYDGSVRTLALGLRVDERLAAWFLSGHWTNPTCPLVWSGAPEHGTDGRVRARFSLRDGAERVEGLVQLGSDHGLEKVVWKRRGEVRGIQREPDHDTDERRGYSARLGSMRIVLWLERALSTRRIEDIAFERPRVRPAAVFSADAPSALEVRRADTGNLLVRAKLDGEELWFLLDTGAGANVLDAALETRSKPERLGGIGVSGVGGAVDAALRRYERLELGPLAIDAPVFLTTDLSDLDGPLGCDVSGILGFDVFARCVAVFRAAESRIDIHDPETFEGPGIHWERATLAERVPVVRVVLEGNVGHFKIDTGSNGAVEVQGPAIERWGLLDGREVRASHSGGIGGTIETLEGEVASFELGGRRFVNLTAEFIDVEAGVHADGYDGNIGLDLLDEFEVVFDYVHERIGWR